MTAREEPGAEAALVGLWRLATAEHTVDGARVYPFGAAPIGAMLIAADGVVSCQVARSEALAPGEERDPPLHERLFAVWGRWSTTADLLVISVVGSCDPALVGVAQRRRYTLDGDTLTLENLPEPGAPAALRYSIRWVRTP